MTSSFHGAGSVPAFGCGGFSSNATTSASVFSSSMSSFNSWSTPSFSSPFLGVNSGSSPFGATTTTGSSLFGATTGSSPFGATTTTGPSLFGATTGNHASSIAASATSTFSAATAQRSPNRSTNSTAPTSKNEPHADVNKAMSGLSDTEDDLKKKISFLSGFVVAFKEQTHTDIQLKPNNGPCIPAHKALLAARSEIFKNMLDSDGCKAPPSDADTITLSELNNEELESLLEFLYTGNLPLDKLEKHVYSLYAAADKYEIPYLQESCEHYMLNSLNASNAIDVLEIADAQSNKALKETTLNFIIRNMKDMVFTAKYEVFASSNPHLCMQITRAFVDAKSN